MNPGNIVFQDQSFYTPWMERGGDYLVIQFEVLDKGPSGSSVTVTPWTKNDEDADTGESQMADSGGSATSVTLDTVGIATLNLSYGDAKELIRLKFVGTAGTVESGEYWIDYRIIGFVWYDKATA